jgi:hypothetical protein
MHLQLVIENVTLACAGQVEVAVMHVSWRQISIHRNTANARVAQPSTFGNTPQMVASHIQLSCDPNDC